MSTIGGFLVLFAAGVILTAAGGLLLPIGVGLAIGGYILLEDS